MRWLKSWFTRRSKAVVPAEALKPAVPAADLVPTPPARTGRRFARAEDAARLFDAEATRRLAELLAQPAQARDPHWFDAFYDAVWHAALSLPWDTPVEGPDGFPYLRLDLPGADEFEPSCLGALAPQCVKHGFGAAIFAHADDPIDRAAFVFSMGRIDSILRFDDPEGDSVDRAEAAMPGGDDFAVERHGAHQQLTVKAGHAVMVGKPSHDYLPPSSAQALYNHLVHGWGYEAPRIGLMADPQMRPTRSLIIGMRRSDFPSDAPVDEMAAMLSWYLPPGRMLMLLPEAMDPQELAPLADYLEGGIA